MDADEHMSEAARPHVLCNAENLMVDPAHMSRASCPKHRPGYLCRSRTYHHYAKGAFRLACDVSGLELADFPKDHLKDIMESLTNVSEPALKVRTFEDISVPPEMIAVSNLKSQADPRQPM